MSYWIELHCDFQTRTDRPAGADMCHSDTLANPGTLVERLEDLRMGARSLRKDAKGWGWKRINGQWACKACAEWLPARPADPADAEQGER